MNEKEIMNLLNSMDEDLIDEKIDDLLDEKGVFVNMESIKEKSLNKLNGTAVKKSRISKKPFIAAAVVAALTVSTVYADEISAAINSFFNKSVVYSTVVDGDAYYLPDELKLDDRFSISDVSVSKGHLDMTLKSNTKLEDNEMENLNVTIIPKNNESLRYTVGGYGGGSVEKGYTLSFYNESAGNYDIAPFQDFTLMISGKSYDVSLSKSGNIQIDENLSVGKSEIVESENIPTIANVAGTITEKDGFANIQLIASFDDPDLHLSLLGKPAYDFTVEFENTADGGVLGSASGGVPDPILAYDAENNPYTLKDPEDTVRWPNTIFETTAKAGTPLTVKLPSVEAHYEKDVAEFTLSIPKEGEIVLDKELDFIIQKSIIKSIKRTSETTAVVEFELNNGSDKSVSIIDMGASSADVIKAKTVINGNTALMTMTFDKDVEEAAFRFSWPYYVIHGNWSIELGAAK